MDAEEPHSDGWLAPLTAEERTDLEIRGLWIAWDYLRAEVDDLKARMAELERQRARDEDR